MHNVPILQCGSERLSGGVFKQPEVQPMLVSMTQAFAAEDVGALCDEMASELVTHRALHQVKAEHAAFNGAVPHGHTP